jgi:outer membrane lipoprotein SlyB
MENFLGCATMVFAIALMTAPAGAKGCIKGAAVGGVTGHVAGHHGFLGAAAGCVIGHHEASKNEKKKQNQSQPQSE